MHAGPITYVRPDKSTNQQDLPTCPCGYRHPWVVLQLSPNFIRSIRCKQSNIAASIALAAHAYAHEGHNSTSRLVKPNRPTACCRSCQNIVADGFWQPCDHSSCFRDCDGGRNRFMEEPLPEACQPLFPGPPSEPREARCSPLAEFMPC